MICLVKVLLVFGSQNLDMHDFESMEINLDKLYKAKSEMIRKQVWQQKSAWSKAASATGLLSSGSHKKYSCALCNGQTLLSGTTATNVPQNSPSASVLGSLHPTATLDSKSPSSLAGSIISAQLLHHHLREEVVQHWEVQHVQHLCNVLGERRAGEILAGARVNGSELVQWWQSTLRQQVNQFSSSSVSRLVAEEVAMDIKQKGGQGSGLWAGDPESTRDYNHKGTNFHDKTGFYERVPLPRLHGLLRKMSTSLLWPLAMKELFLLDYCQRCQPTNKQMVPVTRTSTTERRRKTSHSTNKNWN